MRHKSPRARSALKLLPAPVLPLREKLVSPTLASLTKGREPGGHATRGSGHRCRLRGPSHRQSRAAPGPPQDEPPLHPRKD